jgi:DnaJ-class molecular chaperone
MHDPYEVLGVQRSASAAELKSAYRRLAKKLHPDANKHDPKAAGRFAELNAAYEILGDADKRKAFDRGEIDAEGKPRFRGFEGFGAGGPGGAGGREGFETFTWGPGGFQRSAGRGGGGAGFGGIEDLLKDVFGGAARGRGGPGGFPFETEDFGGGAGRDVTVPLTITLEEAAKGGTRRVQLPTGKSVEVKIPAGLASGQQIRLKGQGLAGPGGAPGDALISVTIAPHPVFQVDGADLRMDLPVTLYEAVLGGKVRVPTLTGAVDLAIPANTGSGRVFRLRGKGLKSKDGAGDQLVTIRIVLPERPDPELEELMRKWRESATYDPRRDMS